MFMPNPLVNALGLTLLHFVWQGLLIGLIYALGKSLFRTASTHVRYTWALGTLLALAVTPVVSFLYFHSAPDGAVSDSTARLAAMARNAAGSSESSGFSLGLVLPWIVAVWTAGVSLMSIRTGLGWWYLHQLRRTVDYHIAPRHRAMLVQLSARLGLGPRVRLGTSAHVNGPMLIGLLRPIILMPASLLSGLTPRQLEMILAHELAHLRRLDHVVNLFQVAMEILLFHQPVVRWVSRDLRVEREIASDELAADLAGDRLAYSETLLALEKQRLENMPFALGMADHQVAARVRRLLQPPRRQAGSIGLGMATLVMALATAAAGLYQTWKTPDAPVSEPASTASTASLPGERAAQADTATEPDTPGAARETDSVGESADDRTTATTSRDESVEPPTDEPPPRESGREESSPDAGGTPEEGNGEVDRMNDEPATNSERNENAPRRPPDTTQSPASADLEDQQQPEADIDQAIGDDIQEQGTLDNKTRLAMRSEPPALPPAPEASEPEELTGGTPISQPAPDYPAAARRLGHDGSVEIRFTVDRQGRVRDPEVVHVSRSGYGFGEAAMRAVQQWRFEPFMRGGEPVSRTVETGFDFTEPEECRRQTGSRLTRC